MNTTWNIVGAGQMNQGAVHGPQEVAEMFVKLYTLAMKNKADQKYESPTFSITITYAD